MIETVFYNVLISAGFSPQAPIPADGKIHRCSVEGDKPRQKSGWYALHADPATGIYGNWKTGEEIIWRPDKSSEHFDHDKCREKRRQQQEDRAKRKEEEWQQCREECTKIWSDATHATNDHSYLKRKQVHAHGIKVLPDGRLVIPLRDTQLVLHGVQYIPGHGEKWFHKYSNVHGHYFSIGEPNGYILIVEGYATGATLYELIGHAVAVAFSSYNLQAVAEALHAAHPDLVLIICGDDDRNKLKNTGRSNAEKAAQAVGGLFVIPKFKDTASGTDFNDLNIAEGENVVRAQLEAVISLAVPVPDVVLPEIPEPVSSTEPAKPAEASSLFISAADLLSTPCRVDYLIRKLIERNTTGQIFGPSGEGKSFVAFDWSLCVGTGRTVNGLQASKGVVVYLAGEGHVGLKRRLQAWQLHHDVPIEDLSLIHLSRNTISMDGSGVDKVIAEAQTLAQLHGVPVALFVIDTLARHLQGDESNAKDMTAFIDAVDRLRNAFAGAVSLIVHHSGHSAEANMRGRGSSALRAAMDFEIHCDKGLLTFTKMKDAEVPEPIAFKLRPIVVGEDDNGDPLTSCIVEYGARAERHQEYNTITAMERLAIETLINAAAATEMANGDLWGALVGDWRKAFYDARWEQDANLSRNTLKQAFSRASENLINKKLVSVHEHLRIPTDPKHQNEIVVLMSQRVQGTQMVLVPECTEAQ